MKRLFTWGVLFLVFGISLLGFGAYPDRPITIICPWAPGGGTDRIARALAVELSDLLRVPVGVENRTGGGGVVGHVAGAQAAPDGYTLTLVTLEIATMHWLGLTDLTYTDYEPIALINADYAAINVRADAPWETYIELHTQICKNPGKLLASGTAVGGIWDIARAGWLRAAGFNVNDVPWVPSLGAAPALTELIAGGVDIVTCSLAEAIPLIEAGAVKPLAFMGPARHPHYPDVPTLRELGINWICGTWRGLAAPKGTPHEIIAALTEAVEKAVRSERFVDFMEKSGFGIEFLPAEEFGRFMKEQDQVLGELLTMLGLAK